MNQFSYIQQISPSYRPATSDDLAPVSYQQLRRGLIEGAVCMYVCTCVYGIFPIIRTPGIPAAGVVVGLMKLQNRTFNQDTTCQGIFSQGSAIPEFFVAMAPPLSLSNGGVSRIGDIGNYLK